MRLAAGMLCAIVLAPAGASAAVAFEQRMTLDDGTRARMWLDAEAHHVTDLVHVTVEAVSPPGRVPSVLGADRRLGDLRVVAVDEEGPAARDGGAVGRRWTYTLEPLHGGEVVLRPITIRSTDERGEAVVRANTRALTLEVNGALPEGVSLINPRDITRPAGYEPRLAAAPVALLGALLLGALLLGAILAVARVVRARPQAGSQPGVGTADVAAATLQRLALVEAELARGALEPGPVWRLLASAMRDYLAGRFGLPSERRTSEELRQLIAGAKAPLAQHAPALGRLLGACDTGRFAPVSDLRPIAEAVAAARGLVRETG